MPEEAPRRLVSTGSAAKEVGLDPTTLQRWVNSGRLTPTDETPGGHLRWDLDDLRRQLAAIKQQRRDQQS